MGLFCPKNPKIADFVITKALQRKDPGFQNVGSAARWMTPLENSAREALFKRFEIEGDRLRVLWEHLKTVPKWERNLQKMEKVFCIREQLLLL